MKGHKKATSYVNIILALLFPLLSRDSTLTRSTKLQLYNLVIRPTITYAAPVWSSTSLSNYRQLQTIQSKYLRVIGNFPKRTPITQLHASLNAIPIRDFIYKQTVTFYNSCLTHNNPLIRSIGNYTLFDLLTTYPKYIHKRPKHILLSS